jgi:SNF2 family DNA or RNA helicase
MPHSPPDIWSQFRFLNKKIFGMDFYRFQKVYCVKKRLGNKTYLDRFGRERPVEVISHYVNTEQMRRLIFQHAIKYDRDVITLPEAVHTIIDVPLEPSARALYEKLKKEMRAILGSADEYGEINERGEITVTNGLVKTIRLMQITGGCVPDDNGNLQLVSTAKREALVEVMDDIDKKEPLVIFCVSYHDMDNCKAVALESGRTVSEHSGRVKQLEEWQAGVTDVLVVQIRAGGVGIDLTRACYNIMYSTGHGAGDYDQAICRSHRPGQMADHVNYIHLHCAGTIDGVIYKAIQEKRSIVEAIMHHIKKEKGEEDD